MRPGAIISTLLASAAFGSSSAIHRDYRSLAGGSIESFSESPRSLDVELVRSVVVNDSVLPAGVLKRQNGAATSCRTIHNWFKWKTFPDQQKYLPDIAKTVTTIGWTRMDKTFLLRRGREASDRLDRKGRTVRRDHCGRGHGRGASRWLELPGHSGRHGQK
jgi:hypothetical protein